MKQVLIFILLFAFVVTSANAQTKDTVSAEKYLSKISLMRLCIKVNSARDAGRNSYEALVKYIQEYADEEGISYKSPEELISKHFMKIQCLNTNSLKMRKTASVFKYSIEKANYKFVRDALIIENEEGTDICNPNIDFSQTEIIDGKEESLIDFIDKILKEDGMSAVHNFPGLRTLKLDLERCVKLANQKNK